MLADPDRDEEGPLGGDALGACVARDRRRISRSASIALTGSLGVRASVLERTVAGRKSVLVDSPWGPARVKVGAGRMRPEHDDVARIAREHGLPYRAVAAEIERLAAGTQPAE